MHKLTNYINTLLKTFKDWVKLFWNGYTSGEICTTRNGFFLARSAASNFFFSSLFSFHFRSISCLASVNKTTSSFNILINSVQTWANQFPSSFMPVSFFHCLHPENAIFAPTTGRFETPITALYCISGEK